MRTLSRFSCTSVILALFAALRLTSAEPTKGSPSLSRTHFPAKGQNEAILDVGQAGRYALLTKSKQGTRIQLVDRMVGPAESDGKIGEQDGRLDLLLDAGRYKVILNSSNKGRGEVVLGAHPFTELNVPEPPLLEELKPIRETLEDFQQRSWWIHISKRRTIYLEAQGRNLSDLRLWKDGAWLLDALPNVGTAEPMKGRPERSCSLVVDLNPGTYLLRAYGGPPLAWAKETGEHAFSLRFGIPGLPSACRMNGALSPFGTDRYLVSKEANVFLLQLAEKKDFRLEVGSFDFGDALGGSEASATISKKSADPECKIQRSINKPFALVTVSGTPGERYIFQCFEQKDYYSFNTTTPQDYRISTLHSGYLDDNIDASCILVSSQGGDPHTSVYAADVIHLGGEKGWARRFNLLGDNTLFFFVEEAGNYQIQSSGTEALYRFEPFFLSRPQNYKTPDFEESGSVFSLDKGYWVLTIHPNRQGILKVALQQKGYFQRMQEWVMGSEQLSPTPAKGACTLERVRLDPKYTYSLYMNRQDGVDHGVVLRPQPLHLEDPLPLTLSPGQQQSLSVRVASDSQMRVLTLSGARFTCLLDGAAWSESLLIKPGSHQIQLKNEGTKSLAFTLQTIPAAKLPDAPPRFLDTDVKKTLAMRLPAIAEGAPLFLDLGVREQRTALLSVRTPGLYRIETTGLLKTALTLRSAVRTKLFSVEANGVGRNALLQQYLKEGEYLLTTQTLDRSAGHTGIHVARTEVTEGGQLIPGRECKAEVPANQGVLYSFALPAAGKYSLRTLGQNRFFPCRLEDSEGWPILTPGTPSNLTQSFRKGSYRFLSLPVDVDTQRLSTLALIPPKRNVKGKGPHALALNEKVANRWREPKAGAQRARDIYTIQVPADLNVALHLGGEQMQGILKRIGSDEAPREAPPGKGWSGLLPAGEYRLEVECARMNDLVEYWVQLSTQQLAPGLRQELSVPGEVDVRLAKDSVVEIYSQGQEDVRGLLYRKLPEGTASGMELVEYCDDSFNDWNFRIARRLPAGEYLLKVESVGGKANRTTVGMSAPSEVSRETLLLNSDLNLDLGGNIAVFPLETQEDAELFSVRITGPSLFGCIFERTTPNGFVPILTRTGKSIAFEVPLQKASGYRLRLWSADHQSEQVRLRTQNVHPTPMTLENLAALQTLTPIKVHDELQVFAKVSVGRGGTFAPEPTDGFSYATSQDQVLQPSEDGFAALPAGEVFLSWDATSAKSLRACLPRKTLGEPSGPLKLRLPKGLKQELDVKGSSVGPTVVRTRALSGAAACTFATPEGGHACLSHGYVLRGDEAIAVSEPGHPRPILLWNPQEEASAFSDIHVEAKSFTSLAEGGTLPSGSNQGKLSAGSGKQWNLGSGTKQVDLVLEDGLVAYLSEGNKVLEVAFAKGESTHASFTTTASRLKVLSLAEASASYEVDLRARVGTSLPALLPPGKPFEKVFTQGGSLRLDVAGEAENRVLNIAGTKVSCEWMDAEGILHEGLRHELRGGGSAMLSFGPGLVKAWISAKDKELEERRGPVSNDAPLPLEPNTIVALEGRNACFTFKVAKSSALHLRTECPAVLSLSRHPDGILQAVTEGYPETMLDATLEPGTYAISLRALSGEALRGTAELKLADVIPIVKTFGPESLVHAGESLTFVFSTKRKADLGIGLKAERDALSCQLLRIDGTILGTGIQQFQNLPAGTYLLRVNLPPGEEPVKFTPVVVGMEPPGSGPPEDVLRNFLAQLGLASQ